MLINRKSPLFLIALSIVLVSACDDKNAYVAPPLAEVKISHATPQMISEHLEFTGNTQAYRTVQLVARVQGYLEKVFFHDGDVVKKGQLLFQIQQNTYQAKLQQAESQILQQKANLDHAQTELNRFTDLVRQHAAAQTDLDKWRFERDNAKAALVAAKANRDLVNLDLDYTKVAAPFDGRIDRRLKDPGNLVGAGEATLLAEINQINPIYVYFTINETDLLKMIKKTNVSPGEAEKLKIPAELALSDDSGYPYQGSLDFSAISVTPTTGTLLLRAIYPNSYGSILPGLFARVRVLVVNSEKLALLIPETAIAYDQLGAYLMTVDEQNVVVRKAVKLGTQVADKRAITEGINAQDRIIVNGLLRAIPGSKVKPISDIDEPKESNKSLNPTAPPGTKH